MPMPPSTRRWRTDVGTQLVFWSEDGATEPPVETYRALLDGRTPTGLAPLPLDQALTALADAVTGFDPLPAVGGPCPVFAEVDGAIVELSWSPAHVLVELRGRWTGDLANRVIDVMLQYDCPLYDPQIDERFTT